MKAFSLPRTRAVQILLPHNSFCDTDTRSWRLKVIGSGTTGREGSDEGQIGVAIPGMKLAECGCFSGGLPLWETVESLFQRLDLSLQFSHFSIE